VKEYLLVLFRQAVGGVGPQDILLNAAGGIPEEKTLETLRRRGLVDSSIIESLLIEINVPRCSAEDGFDDLFARLDLSPDLLGEQAQPAKLPKGVVSQRLLPSAQRL